MFAGLAGAGAQLARFAIQVPEGAELSDPVARLAARVDAGEVQLDFHPVRGYLDSLLEVLDIPEASQSIVFSKTSFQADRINPDNPRALYFNDDVYMGWVPGGPVVEIASVDPSYGTIFYTVDQSQTGRVRFEREGSRCANCHLPTRSDIPIPRLMMMSVVTNEIGTTLGSNVLVTTDRSRVESRWGGWYVTGVPSDTAHVGNKFLSEGNKTQQIVAETRLAELAGDLSFLRPTSDAVALMLLAHQSEIHNLIGEAAFAVRAILDAVGSENRELDEREQERIGESVEPLVRALLFVDAAAPNGAGSPDSPFAREFVQRGPRDSKGRSLRELDLGERLLRYSLSYLVYSEGFDGLPSRARDYVYQRFLDIFEGREQSAAFAHLSRDDGRTLVEILTETKPSFAEWVASR